MITTAYICDKCKQEQTDTRQFWEVGVVTNNVNLMNDYGHVRSERLEAGPFRMHVCRPCLESFGINVSVKQDEPVPARPTLEELIREIVAEAKS